MTGSYAYILTDTGSALRLDLQIVDNKTIDEPIRKLSSLVEYLVVTDKFIMMNDKVYKALGDIPSAIQFMAIPVTREQDIVQYEPVEADDMFISEGYAKNIRDASNVLVLPSLNLLSKSCTPADLIVIRKDGDIYTGLSGRTAKISPKSIEKVHGRYIYISSAPMFQGNIDSNLLPPYTYTKLSLIEKSNTLNARLQSYGHEKVESLGAFLRALPTRLSVIRNQYKASSLYDDIVKVLDRVREME